MARKTLQGKALLKTLLEPHLTENIHVHLSEKEPKPECITLLNYTSVSFPPVYQSFFTHPDNQQVFLFVFMFQIIIVLMPPFDIIVEN